MKRDVRIEREKVKRTHDENKQIKKIDDASVSDQWNSLRKLSNNFTETYIQMHWRSNFSGNLLYEAHTVVMPQSLSAQMKQRERIYENEKDEL